MDPGEVGKLVELVGDGDPKLVREFAGCCSSDTCKTEESAPAPPSHSACSSSATPTKESSSGSGKRNSPICPTSSRSLATVKGCEQQVLVHMAGNVIFSSARF